MPIVQSGGGNRLVGVLKGALMGSRFGPWGALGGALLEPKLEQSALGSAAMTGVSAIGDRMQDQKRAELGMNNAIGAANAQMNEQFGGYGTAGKFAGQDLGIDKSKLPEALRIKLYGY